MSDVELEPSLEYRRQILLDVSNTPHLINVTPMIVLTSMQALHPEEISLLVPRRTITITTSVRATRMDEQSRA